MVGLGLIYVFGHAPWSSGSLRESIVKDSKKSRKSSSVTRRVFYEMWVWPVAGEDRELYDSDIVKYLPKDQRNRHLLGGEPRVCFTSRRLALETRRKILRDRPEARVQICAIPTDATEAELTAPMSAFKLGEDGIYVLRSATRAARR